MKTDNHHTLFSYSRSYLLVLSLLAAPGTVVAEELRGELSLGIANTDINRPSSYFGRNTGISDDQQYMLGKLDLRYRPENGYLDLSGNNLGIDARQFGLRAGQRGKLGIELKHSEIPTLLALDAMTPYDGAGSTTLTRPTGFTRGVNTGAMTNMSSHLKPVDLRLDRSTDQVRLFVTPDQRWRIEMGAEQYERKGINSIAGLIAFTTTTMLPAPVNEQTNSMNTAINYRGERAQWTAGYRLSNYTNLLDSLTWDSLYTSTSSTLTQGRLALAPDNRHQAITLNGAIKLADAHRLSLSAEHGRMEQNDSLLPYTVNPNSATPTALPRDSAQARIDTTQLNLQLTSRPLPRLTVNTRYRYQQNDNRTPSALFLRVVNDSGAQVNTASSLATTLLPYDFSTRRLSVDSHYATSDAGTFKLGLRHEVQDRSYRAVRKTTENTLSAGYRRQFTGPASADVSYERAQRRADTPYDPNLVVQSTLTQGYLNTITDPTLRFTSHPLLRQYDIADRVRDKFNVAFSVNPIDSLTLGLTMYRAQDRYSDSPMGLQNATVHSATLDIDYSPAEGASLYGYVTGEKIESTLDARQFGKRVTNTDPTLPMQGYADTRYDWQTRNRDEVTTIGLGARKRLLADRLTTRLQFNRSRATNALFFDAGSSLSPVAGLPNSTVDRDRVELRGDYKLVSGFSLGLGAIYDRYQSYNWAVNGVAPGSNAAPDLITLTGPTNNFHAYTVYTLLSYKW